MLQAQLRLLLKLPKMTIKPTLIAFLLFLTLVVSFAVTLPVTAQTKSATPAAATLEETAGGAIDEIKKRIEDNTSKVKGAINTLLNAKFGTIGEVQRINDGALTFQNRQGTTILVIDDTITITKNGKALPLEDIAVGNWVTVLGTKATNDFTPKFILVSETTLRPKTQIVAIGPISEITSKAVTIIDRASGESKSFTITRSTVMQDDAGEKAVIADFEEDVTVLITGFDTETGFQLATLRSLAPLTEE